MTPSKRVRVMFVALGIGQAAQTFQLAGPRTGVHQIARQHHHGQEVGLGRFVGHAGHMVVHVLEGAVQLGQVHAVGLAGLGRHLVQRLVDFVTPHLGIALAVPGLQHGHPIDRRRQQGILFLQALQLFVIVHQLGGGDIRLFHVIAEQAVGHRTALRAVIIARHLAFGRGFVDVDDVDGAVVADLLGLREDFLLVIGAIGTRPIADDARPFAGFVFQQFLGRRNGSILIVDQALLNPTAIAHDLDFETGAVRRHVHSPLPDPILTTGTFRPNVSLIRSGAVGCHGKFGCLSLIFRLLPKIPSEVGLFLLLMRCRIDPWPKGGCHVCTFHVVATRGLGSSGGGGRRRHLVRHTHVVVARGLRGRGRRHPSGLDLLVRRDVVRRRCGLFHRLGPARFHLAQPRS